MHLFEWNFHPCAIFCLLFKNSIGVHRWLNHSFLSVCVVKTQQNPTFLHRLYT